MFRPNLESLTERVVPNYAAVYDVVEGDDTQGQIYVEYTDDGVAMNPVYLDPQSTTPVLRSSDFTPAVSVPVNPSQTVSVTYTATAGTDNGNGPTGGNAITVAGYLAFVYNLNNPNPE